MAPHMNDDNDMILTSSDIENDGDVDVARRRGSGSRSRSRSRSSDPTTTTTTTTMRMDDNDDSDINDIDDDDMTNDRSLLKRKWWQPLGQSTVPAATGVMQDYVHSTTTTTAAAGRTSLPSPPSLCPPPVVTSALLPQRPSLCPSVVAPTPPPRRRVIMPPPAAAVTERSSQQQQQVITTTPGITRKAAIRGNGRQHQQQTTASASALATATGSPPRPSKSVHFAPLVKKKTIKHHKDFSDEEFFMTWLSNEELHDILQDCIKTVKMMVRGEIILEDVDGLCVRGLEFKTPEGSRARKANKAKGIQAVLTEQAQQQETKGSGARRQQHSSPSRLSMVYRDATRHVRRKARAMAQNDEQAARTIYNESNVNTSAGTVDCRLDIVVCWNSIHTNNGEEAMPTAPVPSTPPPKMKASSKTGTGGQPRRSSTSSPTTVYDPLDGWSSPLVVLEQQQRQYSQN